MLHRLVYNHVTVMATVDQQNLDPKYKNDLKVRIETAQKLKNDGNELYKQKKFSHATGKYHRALLQVKLNLDRKSWPMLPPNIAGNLPSSTPVPEEYHGDIISIQADCYNNLAACLLQKEEHNYERVLEYCNQVLTLFPDNLKAAFRKSVALYNLKKTEEALVSLKDLSLKHPDDAAVKRYIKLCQEDIRKHELSLKKAYQGFFNDTSQQNQQEVNSIS